MQQKQIPGRGRLKARRHFREKARQLRKKIEARV